MDLLTEKYLQENIINEAFNSIADIIFVIDDKYYIREVNSKEGSYLLFPRENIINKHVKKIGMPEFLTDLTINHLSKVFSSGKIEEYEYSIEKNNKKHFFECRMMLGNKYVIAIIRDITKLKIKENKANKKALEESNSNYKILVETSPNGIIIRDFDNIYFVNKKAKEIFNINSAEQLCFNNIFNKDDLITFNGRLTAVKNGIDVSYKEFTIKKESKENIIIETKPVFITYKGKPAFQIVFRDVSLQKKLQQERFEKEVMLETNINLRREIDNRLIIEDELRKSLDQNELLLKEIHHRIKNNFQVISSLINYTKQNYLNTALSKAFVNINARIKSMAIVHDFFYKSDDFSSVQLIAYLNKIYIENYRENSINTDESLVIYKTRLRNVCVKIDEAITIGLIFNELLIVCRHIMTNFTNKSCNFVRLKRIDQQTIELSLLYKIAEKTKKEDIFNQIDLSLIEVLISQVNGKIEKDTKNCMLNLKIQLTKIK